MKRVILVLLSSASVFLMACGGGGGGGSAKLEAFNSSCFPLVLSGAGSGYGDLDFGRNGDLIVPNNETGDILVVDRETCVASTLTTIPLAGDQLVAVVYDRARNKVFAGTEDGLLYQVDLPGGANTVIESLEPGNDVDAIAIAPEGYGSFGGQLILATGDGQLLAYEPESATAVTIWDNGSALSDLVFAEDGTLYVVNYDSGAINAVSAAGVVSTFVDGFNAPDGIEIDDDNGRMFVADSSDDILYEVSMPGAAVTVVRPIGMGGGWFVTGLAFDGFDTLFILDGDSGEGAFVDALVFPPFDTSCFPLAVPGTNFGSGDMAFDADGNLIFNHRENDEVLVVDRLTCTMSTLATIPTADILMSIVYHPEQGMIYAGATDGVIYAIDPSNGTSTSLANLGDYINGLAVAPEGYGSYGGQLLAATASGELVAVNTDSAATTVIADSGGVLSDLVFAHDGTLYVVDNTQGEVLTISAAGMVSTFATGFAGPDGIAIDEIGRKLFVSDADADTLYSVRLSNGFITDLGTVDFDSGYYPSGLAFDGFKTLLAATEEDQMLILALTP